MSTIIEKKPPNVFDVIPRPLQSLLCCGRVMFNHRWAQPQLSRRLNAVDKTLILHPNPPMPVCVGLQSLSIDRLPSAVSLPWVVMPLGDSGTRQLVSNLFVYELLFAV